MALLGLDKQGFSKEYNFRFFTHLTIIDSDSDMKKQFDNITFYWISGKVYSCHIHELHHIRGLFIWPTL